jgi:hypothetical protein
MFNWRQSLLARVGSGMLAGITHEKWTEVRKNSHVDAGYRARATLVSIAGLANDTLRRFEQSSKHVQAYTAAMSRPLIILGHWRSGTTHLQQLLSCDRQFTFPTHFQVFFPHICLCMEGNLARVLGLLHKGTRMSDNLVRDITSPGEDEFATCIMTGKSPFMGYVFPREQEHYDQFLTFRRASSGDLAEWRKALLTFLGKISMGHQRPLLLKSPTHTCRIRLLMEMFPDARFVHVNRHPYDVLRSTYYHDQLAVKTFRLQMVSNSRLKWIVERYKEMYEVFFEEKAMVGPDRFHEIRYDDLVQDACAELKALYEHLSIDGFEVFRPSLMRYLASVGNYQNNRYPELPKGAYEEIKKVCEPMCDAWQYTI